MDFYQNHEPGGSSVACKSFSALLRQKFCQLRMTCKPGLVPPRRDCHRVIFWVYIMLPLKTISLNGGTSTVCLEVASSFKIRPSNQNVVAAWQPPDLMCCLSSRSLPSPYLFSQAGTHVCDNSAVIALTLYHQQALLDACEEPSPKQKLA